jgi:ferredoxin-type protein NapG
VAVPRGGAPAINEQRRQMLRSVALGGFVAGMSLLGWLPQLAAHEPRLRPPGAIPERDFLAACIKCGQCVQVCPVEAIVLADAPDGFGIGVPHIEAREQACDFSCDALQCILACPTGALSHLLAKPEQVEMGLARLVPERQDSCLARQGRGFKGLARTQGLHRYAAIDRWKPVPIASHPYDLELCDLCVRECPVKGAISLEALDGNKKTPVVHDACVGCGMCEMICPVEPAPLVVDARRRPSRTGGV